jgi:hypothetical protein
MKLDIMTEIKISRFKRFIKEGSLVQITYWEDFPDGIRYETGLVTGVIKKADKIGVVVSYKVTELKADRSDFKYSRRKWRTKRVNHSDITLVEEVKDTSWYYGEGDFVSRMLGR